MPEGSGVALPGDDIFNPSWVPPVSDPKVAPNADMEEWEPLDPGLLDLIVDPRSSREEVGLHDVSPSPGEELSDQTTDDTGAQKGGLL